MSRTKAKFSIKYFLFGILIGILLSGVFALLISSNDSKNAFVISRNPSTTSISLSESNSISRCTPSSDSSNLINLNNASVDELDLLPGIGEAKANNIIAWREKYGNFKDISELMYVSGISDNIFQQLCNLVTTGN